LDLVLMLTMTMTIMLMMTMMMMMMTMLLLLLLMMMVMAMVMMMMMMMMMILLLLLLLQLIKDCTVLLVAAAAFGTVFDMLGQPMINGYLAAGAFVGPGGFKLINELVQVESIAQLGVYLLLFTLGVELSVDRVHRVLGPSIVGRLYAKTSVSLDSQTCNQASGCRDCGYWYQHS